MPHCQRAAHMLHSSGAHECEVQRTMVKEPRRAIRSARRGTRIQSVSERKHRERREGRGRQRAQPGRRLHGTAAIHARPQLPLVQLIGRPRARPAACEHARPARHAPGPCRVCRRARLAACAHRARPAARQALASCGARRRRASRSSAVQPPGASPTASHAARRRARGRSGRARSDGLGSGVCTRRPGRRGALRPVDREGAERQGP